MGMPVSVIVSSIGNSRAINLDWLNGGFTGVAVTGSSSGTFAYTVQTTLDDLQHTPASAVSWVNDPTLTAATSNSSEIILYQAPVAGIRLNSTALSSAVLTMKVNQAVL